MKADNPFFYLPSSQLFPHSNSMLENESNITLLKSVKRASEYIANKRHNEALSIYNSLIDENPDQPFLFACRSLLKTEMDEEEGAFYDYQIAKQLDFNYHNLIEWINNSGEMLESDELLELLKQDKSEEQFYINRATLFVQHFEYEKAILDFTKAYELGQNPRVLISKAAVNMRMVRYDKALLDFNRAIEQDANLTQGYLLRAKLFAAIHEFELADNDFNKAVSLNNSEATVFEERAQFYEQSEQWDLAIADYSTVIALNPDDFYVYVMRADLYEKLGKLELALKDYSKAIDSNPYYSDLYQYRGAIREAMGDHKGAGEDYAKFEELEED